MKLCGRVETQVQAASGPSESGPGCEVRVDFRALFEAVPNPLLVLRPDPPRFTIVALNDAYTRATGVARERLLGRALSESWSPLDRGGADDDYRSDVAGALERVLQTRAPVGLEVRAFDALGVTELLGRYEPPRWRAFNTPVLSDRGEVLYLLHRLDDVTARVRTERLREEWISSIAHELLQPLSTISGYAQLLARTWPEHAPAATRYLLHIRRSSELMSRMVADLLDSSLLEVRRIALERSEVDLLELARDTIEQQPELLPRCHVEAAPDADLRVLADVDRVHQVLLNLLVNAHKYAAADTPIVVRVGGLRRSVRVTVENRGPGIAPEDLTRVFERFARGRRLRKRGVTGLGLGLHICRGLIEAQGGAIWAESSSDDVTRFHFTLPLAHPPSDRTSS